MILIAAVDKNWGIGYKGELLCRVSNDLKNFRVLTSGKTVILGSKTLATFPNGRPLPKRRNIIMSHRQNYTVDGAEVAHSVEEAISLVGDDDAVVIGGESVYKQLLPYCDCAVITKFEQEFESDAFIPNLDNASEWELYEESEIFHAEEGDTLPGMEYRFCKYRRKKKMNISDIDKNFTVAGFTERENIAVYSVLDPPFSICGIIPPKSDGLFRRMPPDVAEKVSENVMYLSTHTAGGRVRFKTDSSYFAVAAKLDNVSKMPHFAFTGSIGFDLYAGERHAAGFIPSVDITDSLFGEVNFQRREMTEYTLNFPLYSGVKELYIILDKDARVEAAEPYDIEKPVVFYGSSITQGGCASRPGTCYTSILSRRFGFDHLNLGFSGSAKGEAAMRDYIAFLDMSVFVLDYDHNALSAAHLKATHEPLFKAVREAHPDIPIICINQPFLITGECEQRKNIIRTTVENAKANGDKNVYYIEMSDYISKAGIMNEGSVDLCHPNDLGFHYMAKAVGEILEKVFEK